MHVIPVFRRQRQEIESSRPAVIVQEIPSQPVTIHSEVLSPNKNKGSQAHLDRRCAPAGVHTGCAEPRWPTMIMCKEQKCSGSSGDPEEEPEWLRDSRV